MPPLVSAERKLHVGYLVQQFPPEVGAGPARVLEMAHHWMIAGARVSVLTGMPNRPGGKIYDGYRRRLFLDETWEGIRVHRSWLYATPRHGMVRTLLNNASFTLTSSIQGVRRGGNLDVLIASSPPFFTHLAGQVIAKARGVPLVLEVRDLWPDYLVGMGMLDSRGAPARTLFAMESYLLRRAAAVTVVTRSFARRVVEKGIPPDRVHVMPGGVDAERYYRSEEAPPIAPLQRSRPKEFIVGYLGNFGAGQKLETVIDAAAMLKARDSEVRIVIVGDGPAKESLENAIRRAGVTNVSLHPPIPKEQTRAFYANCDICLVPLAPVAVFQETIPSKIFEILACERPLIASLDGEARTIVESSGAGWTTPPGDAGKLAEALMIAAATSSDERRAMGERGRGYVMEHYSRRSIAQQYLALLGNVASRKGIAPRKIAP